MEKVYLTRKEQEQHILERFSKKSVPVLINWNEDQRNIFRGDGSVFEFLLDDNHVGQEKHSTTRCILSKECSLERLNAVIGMAISRYRRREIERIREVMFSAYSPEALDQAMGKRATALYEYRQADERVRLLQQLTAIATDPNRQSYEIRKFLSCKKLVGAGYTAITIENGRYNGQYRAYVKAITDNVIIDDEYEGRYDFGPYEVRLWNLGLKLEVEILRVNPDNVGAHPHINGSSICFGSITTMVARLEDEMEYDQLLILLRRYLNSYERGDCFMRLSNWTRIDEDDEDREYCDWCEEYGHEQCDCESCSYCEYCDEYHGSNDGCPEEWWCDFCDEYHHGQQDGGTWGCHRSHICPDCNRRVGNDEVCVCQEELSETEEEDASITAESND